MFGLNRNQWFFMSYLILFAAVILALWGYRYASAHATIEENIAGVFVRIQNEGMSESCDSKVKGALISYESGQFITAKASANGVVDIYVSAWETTITVPMGKWIEFNAESNDPGVTERLVEYDTTIYACDTGLMVETNSYYLPWGQQVVNLSADNISGIEVINVDRNFCNGHATHVDIVNQFADSGPDLVWVTANPSGIATYGTIEGDFIVGFYDLDMYEAVLIPGFKTIANCGTQLTVR